MNDRPRYAIIPTNGRECVDQAIEAIYPQVDRVLITWTGDWASRRQLPRPDDNKILYTIWRNRSNDHAPNISAWWNEGLESARTMSKHDFPGRETWDVAIVNDDAIVPEGWFDAVSTAMRTAEGAAGCSGARLGFNEVLMEPGPIAGWPNPLTGFAFILAGEKGLRANEDLHWYFSDNYIDWESRKLGGTVVIPGFHVTHLHANAQMGHDLIARVAVDAQNFVDLYGGMRPW